MLWWDRAALAQSLPCLGKQRIPRHHPGICLKVEGLRCRHEGPWADPGSVR